MNGKPYKGSTAGHHKGRAEHPLTKAKKCKKCRVQADLTRHHIDHNPENNNPKNIEWLCRRCHGRMDAQWQWRHLDKRRKCPVCKEVYKYKRRSQKTCSPNCGAKMMVRTRKAKQ